MKRIILFSALIASGTGMAQTQSSQGTIQQFQSNSGTQIRWEGPAAEALLETLKSHPNVIKGLCQGQLSYSLKPVLCFRQESGAKCFTVLPKNDKEFSIPNFCEGPNPSIIGIGNGKKGPVRLEAEELETLDSGSLSEEL